MKNESENKIETKSKEEIKITKKTEETDKASGIKSDAQKKVGSKRIIFRIVLVILIIVVAAILFFVVLGVGIYWYNWQNKFALSFPYPAVTVDYHILKYSDYIDDLRTLDFFYNAEIKANPELKKPDSDKIKEDVLGRMIKDYFLSQKAKSMGISVSNNDIDQEWQNIITQAGGVDKAEQTLRDIYNWNADQFKNKVLKPFLLRVKMQQQIGLDDNINAAARKKAEDVLALVKEGKTSFEELAKQYSEDTTTASQGGDLGYFSQGDMVQEFEDAVLKLKPGEVSGIVKTQYGYHIIKLLEIIPATEDKPEQFHAEHILFKSKSIDEWVTQEIAKAKTSVFVKGFHWEKSCASVLKIGESCSTQ